MKCTHCKSKLVSYMYEVLPDKFYLRTAKTVKRHKCWNVDCTLFDEYLY